MKLARRAIKDAVKVPIDICANRHRPSGESNVFIFSVGRSGSNWLMELIYSQPGFKYCNQPLWNPNSTIYGHLVPRVPHGKFIHVDGEDEQKLYRYFTLLLSGKIHVRPPWNVLSEDFSFRTSRYVVKIIDGTPSIEWFVARFDIKSVFLIRHPLPRSLSMVERGWPHSVEAFLSDSYFVDRYLTPAIVEECRAILDSGSDLLKNVLSWGLENLASFRSRNRGKWITLTYEELVANPVNVIECLCRDLDLPSPERMYQHIGLPSRSSSAELRSRLQGDGQSDSQRIALLKRWRQHVGAEEERLAFQILDMLEIDAYSYGSLLPRADLLRFEDATKRACSAMELE